MTFEDPYTNETLYAIPALKPNWTLLHVTKCDENGNAWILGNPHFDVEMSRAAENGVIITTEEIVDTSEIEADPANTLIPGFLVKAVVESPGGAKPCSSYPHYDFDREQIKQYMDASKTEEGLKKYLASTDTMPN